MPWKALASLRSAAVAGHLTRDLDGPNWRLGGSVAYAAACWRGLALPHELFSAAGDDITSALLPPATRLLARAEHSTAFLNRYAADGSRVQYVAGVAPPLPTPTLGTPLDLLFLAPVLAEIELAAWLCLPARFVALGVQGWLKGIDEPSPSPDRPARVHRTAWAPAPELLAQCHFAALSDEDLDGNSDVLDLLRRHLPVVALTHGARGCSVFTRQGTLELGALVVDVVDPTGAGDCFAAAMASALAGGADPRSAALLGTAAASVVIGGLGIEPLQRLPELLPERLARLGVV